MTRVRYRRMITAVVTLTCGHHVRARVAGYYPVALLCPACPIPDPAWVTALDVVADGQELHPKGTAPLPQADIADCPPSLAPQRWQLYTVGIARSDRDGFSEYVLHAPTIGDAVILAARAALADEEETEHALVELDDDGLPTIHVVWLRTGMPLHADDTPGLGWGDLRADTPIPPTAQETAST